MSAPGAKAPGMEKPGARKPARPADILIRVRADETLAVAVLAGEPVECRIERSGAPSRLGALYVGRVRRVVPALDAAFVDLGAGPGFAGDGFLPLGKGKKAREGDAVVVEIARDAEGDKGPRLAWRPDPDGAAKDGPAPRLLKAAPAPAIRLIRDWPGPIGRIVADDVDTLLAVKAFCRDRRPDLLDRIARFSGVGDILEAEGLADRLAELLAPWVRLPSGGRINIAPTPALIAIDVDSGQDARAGSAEDTARRVNAEAAREIARQLRLRDLAGLIVAGFLPLRRALHRAQVLQVLKQATAADSKAVHLGGFTRFGLVEMTRARQAREKSGAGP